MSRCLRGLFCCFGGHVEVNFEGFVDKFGNGGLLVGENGGERDVTFEVTNLDNHFVAALGHDDFVHLDMRQRYA